MQPEGAMRISVDCDFSHASCEDALEQLRDAAQENDISLMETKYLRVGLACDLLSVIDLSRIYGIRPSFEGSYKPDEWSLHGINERDFSHLIVWSPGA